MSYRQVLYATIFLLELLFYHLPFTARSQSSLEKIKFSRIDVNAGLSNSNVTCFLQDSKGFMWVGTSDGLNKYDGYQFTVYRQLSGDTTGLLNNSINSIFEDSRGVLWLSTNNLGFYFYDRLEDRFVAIPSLSANGEIVSIREDNNQTLWVTGVLKHQAFVANLNRTTNTWEHHYLFPSRESVYSIIQDSEDEYWVSVIRIGLFKWNKKTNILKSVPETGLSNNLQKIIQDGDKNIWFATRDGLSKLNFKTKTFKHYKADSRIPNNSLQVNVIRDIVSDGRYLWVATENGGLSRMDTRTETFTHFKFDKNDPNSVSDNSIWAVYKDHQNRIWIGTFSKGICVFDKMKDKFAELNVSLNNDIVNAIWKDSKNRLWIGTEGGLTMHQGDHVQQYMHQHNRKETLPNDPVLSIFEDSKNRMWFGTWAGGVSRYNEQANTFINYLPDPNNVKTLSNPNVYNIKEESVTHRMLVSTYNGLNILHNEQLGYFEKYIDTVHEANNYLRTIFQDHHGTLWLGSIAALNRYDLKQHTWTRYLFNESTGSGTVVNCITEDDEGTLWIGTNKGLHQMKNNSIVETYTTLNGFPNDIVNGILVDHNDNLWLSTTNGISKFNPQSKSITNYDINDGLISNEFKPNACFKSSDGQFFFGGKGVNVFYPDSIKTNPQIPSVFLTGLKIFNKVVNIRGADSILHQHISETREITLKPEYNFFTIEYVALNFTSSNKNQFAYKLEGFDNDWIQVGTQRFATFTNLDPDTYVFRVKASNNDGLWNEEGTSLIIHILPPWWETWWFKSFLMIGLFFIAILISILRTQSIRKTNRILEETVNQKTKHIQAQNKMLTAQGEELAAQNEELVQSQEEVSSQRDLLSHQNENLEAEVTKRTQELVEYNHQLEQFAFISAHNLRAPVARILGLGQILELTNEKPEEKEQIYRKLVHTARELDGVVKDLNTILELKKNNESYITTINLEDEIAMVRENLEREIFSTHAIITTNFTGVGNLHTVKPYLDSILYNLISNAIKYRHPDRTPTIHITTERIENEVCLSVTDNGLGVDVTQFREKLFTLYSRFHLHVEGKGMGLYLIKTQMIAMGGRIEIESEVDKGTTFKAYFKNSNK